MAPTQDEWRPARPPRLALERGQTVTNECLGRIELRLDVTNERLTNLARLLEVLIEEFRGLRRELGDGVVADLRRRVERLEGRA